MIASMDIGFFELNNEEWKIDVVVNQCANGLENGGVRAARPHPAVYLIGTIDNEQMQPSHTQHKRNSRKDRAFSILHHFTVHLCIFIQTYTLHSAAIAALRRALSTASVIHRK